MGCINMYIHVKAAFACVECTGVPCICVQAVPFMSTESQQLYNYFITLSPKVSPSYLVGLWSARYSMFGVKNCMNIGGYKHRDILLFYSVIKQKKHKDTLLLLMKLVFIYIEHFINL